jgi:hypothetical protein
MEAPHERQLQLSFQQVLLFARLLVVVAMLALVGDVLLGLATPNYQGYARVPLAGMPVPLVFLHLLVRTASWTLPVMAFSALLIAYAHGRSRAHFWAIIICGGTVLIGETILWVASSMVMPYVLSYQTMNYDAIIVLLMCFYGPYLFFDSALLVLSLERWDWPQRMRAMRQLTLDDGFSIESLSPGE